MIRHQAHDACSGLVRRAGLDPRMIDKGLQGFQFAAQARRRTGDEFRQQGTAGREESGRILFSQGTPLVEIKVKIKLRHTEPLQPKLKTDTYLMVCKKRTSHKMTTLREATASGWMADHSFPPDGSSRATTSHRTTFAAKGICTQTAGSPTNGGSGSISTFAKLFPEWAKNAGRRQDLPNPGK